MRWESWGCWRQACDASVKGILAALLMLLATAVPGRAQPPVQHKPDLNRLFRIVGRIYNIDPALLAAIADVESGGNPYALSPKGAEGLMQLMPGTARRYAVGNPYDPVENVLGAARFLSALRNWGQTDAPFTVYLPTILAAYNAGLGAVKKYRGMPPYLETREYVRRVLWQYLLGQRPPPLSPPPPVPAAAVRAMAGRTARRTARRPSADAQLISRLAAIRRAREEAAQTYRFSDTR